MKNIKEKALTSAERSNGFKIQEIRKLESCDVVLALPNLSTMRDSVKKLRNDKIDLFRDFVKIFQKF
jgi:hypothetical protein